MIKVIVEHKGRDNFGCENLKGVFQPGEDARVAGTF